MKKILMTLGLCLALASSSAVMAQSPQTENNASNVEQTFKKEKKDKKDKRDFKEKKGKGNRHGECKGRPHGGKKRAVCNEDCNGRETVCDKPCKTPCNKPERPRKMSKKNLKEVLFDGIQLTPEQQTKIANLRESNKEQMRKTSKKYAEKRDKLREDKRKETKKIRDSHFKNIENVLTPDQKARFAQNKAKLADMKKERKMEKKGKKHDRRPNFRHHNSGKDSLMKASDVKRVVKAPEPALLTNDKQN
ncbi:MAG: hypothetical protein HDS73_08680 [Bacteroidales bacterium]|nr:hypothetical protein [Bacteroidales bacterium]